MVYDTVTKRRPTIGDIRIEGGIFAISNLVFSILQCICDITVDNQFVHLYTLEIGDELGPLLGGITIDIHQCAGILFYFLDRNVNIKETPIGVQSFTIVLDYLVFLIRDTTDNALYRKLLIYRFMLSKVPNQNMSEDTFMSIYYVSEYIEIIGQFREFFADESMFTSASRPNSLELFTDVSTPSFKDVVMSQEIEQKDVSTNAEHKKHVLRISKSLERGLKDDWTEIDIEGRQLLKYDNEFALMKDVKDEEGSLLKQITLLYRYRKIREDPYFDVREWVTMRNQFALIPPPVAERMMSEMVYSILTGGENPPIGVPIEESIYYVIEQTKTELFGRLEPSYPYLASNFRVVDTFVSDATFKSDIEDHVGRRKHDAYIQSYERVHETLRTSA